MKNEKIIAMMLTLSMLTAAFVGCLGDRKSTRLNSSHALISYAVFCLKKKKTHTIHLSAIIYNSHISL